MMCISKWLSATLAIVLLASAALIAGEGSTPVADVTPSGPATLLLVAQDKPAAPLVAAQTKPAAPLVVATEALPSCCFTLPADRLVGAKDGPTARVDCPIPVHFTLTASTPSAATPFAADFPTFTGATYEPNFGGTKNNRIFRHTFTFADKFPKDKDACCQCLSGKLTLKLKALSAGTSATAPDAGNDRVGIYCNGKSLHGEPVYTKFPFPVGQTVTKTIQLNPAELCCICQTHRLSFLVEDDTSVTSATLEVTACCVKKCVEKK